MDGTSEYNKTAIDSSFNGKISQENKYFGTYAMTHGQVIANLQFRNSNLEKDGYRILIILPYCSQNYVECTVANTRATGQTEDTYFLTAISHYNGTLNVSLGLKVFYEKLQ